MNGTSKTFLNKSLAEKKLKQNYLLGSTTRHPKTINQDLLHRESLLEEYYDGEQIKTPFGRTIACPVRKALNYLLQSKFLGQHP